VACPNPVTDAGWLQAPQGVDREPPSLRDVG
jgi:hypothetical protein